jgi:hypothetical protein
MSRRKDRLELLLYEEHMDFKKEMERFEKETSDKIGYEKCKKRVGLIYKSSKELLRKIVDKELGKLERDSFHCFIHPDWGGSVHHKVLKREFGLNGGDYYCVLVKIGSEEYILDLAVGEMLPREEYLKKIFPHQYEKGIAKIGMITGGTFG